MAGTRIPKSEDISDQPFADYFWIAGLDGKELLDAYKAQTASLEAINGHDPAPSKRFSVPLQEGPVTPVAEEDDDFLARLEPSGTKRVSKSSYDRLSKLSDEARRSIQSLDGLASLRSNRSSNATIRAVPSSSGAPPQFRVSSAMTEEDFNNVMKKFTLDRDSFYLDLTFKEDELKGTSPTKLKARTQKIVAEDLDSIGSRAPSRTLGSVRRHMSFREMNSTRRQPSLARKVSSRASRRMSSYNAVIPQPDTLESPPNQHPLKRTFEPVLLDRFPKRYMTSELQNRGPFPEYLPMFAFPNDIRIESSDTRPPSTWHEFSMTTGNNTKVPAVCVIIWINMHRETADELEKLCEVWRKTNMTDAERELAVSLAERLAVERAKLSRLLAKLPQVDSGSAEREDLEDRISGVEEKINLMADMLKPLRHGAANRIEGLTDGDTGLWLPRAYGIIGRNETFSPVWKEWLKAVVTPMMEGAVLRVPASSPRVGMWQPLERYVFNICCEAQQPLNSKVQLELGVRELRLYAKREAANELGGSRSTDLYPLFRTLSIPNIVVLFEYLLAEARIIVVSSHTVMLKAVCKALLELMWPLEWAGVYIPVLPARLVQVLEAPCPYLCGMVRKSPGDLPLPDEDFVLVDLDVNEIHSTEPPTSMPKQQRRKLMSLLYLAAPHHSSRGVPLGAPAYAVNAFPQNMFASENTAVFMPAVPSTNLVKLAGVSSTLFGPQAAADQPRRMPILNAFLQAGPAVKSIERPGTNSTARQQSYQGSDSSSPTTANFPPMPATPVSRHDSGYALQSSMRDKRSPLANHDQNNGGFASMRRKASLPFVRHASNPSQISISPLSGSMSTYAASSYATSTMAASTVMPGLSFQPARNTDTTMWVEGHCMQWQRSDSKPTCAVCDEKTEGGFHRCSGCPLVAHAHCAAQITVACASAFFPDQIRVAFARFFASLFYSYRKFIVPVEVSQRKLGLVCKINVDAWTRSLPPEHAAYMEMMRQTQAFNEFVAEREQSSAAASDSVMLFDAIIMAKRGRSGRVRSGLAAFGRGPFGSRPSSGSGTSLDFMQDQTSHLWRLVSAPMSSERPDLSGDVQGRDYLTVIKRAPAKLEDGLLRRRDKKPKKDTVAQDRASALRRMNGLSMNAP